MDLKTAFLASRIADHDFEEVLVGSSEHLKRRLVLSVDFNT
jgi:hypothetical protein